MIDEFDFFGVFVSGALVAACVACVSLLLVRLLLQLTGFYRLVWHPALFNIALFVALWSVSVATLPMIVEAVKCTC